jgi:hypothetical protein
MPNFRAAPPTLHRQVANRPQRGVTQFAQAGVAATSTGMLAAFQAVIPPASTTALA